MNHNPNTLNPWQGRRYYPISQYFKKRFGERVAKISVSIAEACPNRNEAGTLDPCIFCDEWGSAAYHLEKDRELIDQIRFNKTLVSRRLKNSQKFLVYFQSYTNTLDKINTLRQRFESALSEDYIDGLVVGTRPDCLPNRIFPLLEEMHQRSYVMVEIGAQSFFDDQLEFLKRGHSAQKNIQAVLELAKKTNVDICMHLIFGLPNESQERLIETARIINHLPVSNVKLHNLHVLTNTPLAGMYQRGEFVPDELDVYADKVILFLRHLSPEVAVQRLAAVASRWDELIAPKWTAQKMQPIDFIENRMKQSGVMQGDLYDAESLPQRILHV
ncbi:MAG: TIGR01212 family radical SAM protein [Bermanella sp.]